jgi:glycosyltransferase involved in cell wall biosynthesis
MRKIAVITERFYPDSYADAVRITPFVDKLKENEEYDVTIYTSSSSTTETESYNLVTNITPPPRKTGKIIRFLSEILLSVELFIRVIVTGGYDLTVITTPPFFVMLSCSIACCIRKTPYILDVRDIYPRLFFVLNIVNKGSLSGKFLTYLEEFVYSKSQKITTATDGIRKDISHRIEEPSKVLTIRNGYLADRFNISKRKLKRFTISFHGNIGRFQDMGLLLYLAKKCSGEKLNIQFNIIGSGAHDYLIRNSSLSNINYFGRLSNEETATQIAKADIGISFRSNDYISKHSFPVKIYEYIGVGIPVIVTPISEGGDFVKQNKIGYQFSPNQKEKIYKTVKELYQKPKKVQILKQNIMKIREEYSRKKSAELFYNTVKDIGKFHY